MKIWEATRINYVIHMVTYVITFVCKKFYENHLRSLREVTPTREQMFKRSIIMNLQGISFVAR